MKGKVQFILKDISIQVNGADICLGEVNTSYEFEADKETLSVIYGHVQSLLGGLEEWFDRTKNL